MHEEISKEIESHCLEIERCNQRGGRMLSVVDLVEAGTVNREICAFILAAIRCGSSFLVGATPGGAGKTTLMAALLNFIPPKVPLLTAASINKISNGFNISHPTCWICHEIGTGPYYAYLWGEALRLYFKLLDHGHMLATNLHADHFEETYSQICIENKIPEHLFRRMNLLIFLRVDWQWPPKRYVNCIMFSDGLKPHRHIYSSAQGWTVDINKIIPPDIFTIAYQIVDTLLRSGARTIHQVRTFLLTRAEFLNFPIIKFNLPQ